MKIILIGIQGSGKSTQGELLSKKLDLPYLSTGKMFRDIAREESQQGRYIKNIINKGKLVPDKVVVSLIEKYLSRPEYRDGYILDGFPRTLNQAESFSHKVDVVFYIDVSDKEALWRLANRKDATREDETIGAVKERIDNFHRHTKPILNFYKKKRILVFIGGEQTIEQVQKDIIASLKKREWLKKS